MRFKKIITITAWLCLGFIIVCLFLLVNLTNIVEPQIKKRLAKISESYDVEFDIQKIGIFNTFVSKIRINKKILIDSINIDYDIKNFSSIHLNKITVSGLSLNASIDKNNQIKIDGLKFFKPSKDQISVQELPFLALLPDKIILQNSNIVLNAFNNEFLIPFDALSKIHSKDKKILAKTNLYPFGEKISTQITYDMKKGVEFIKVEGKSFDLGHVAPFISKKVNGLQIKGLVDFNIETTSPKMKWKINLSEANLIQPIKASLKDLSTTLLIDNQKLNATGSFGISHKMLPVTQIEYSLNLDLKKDNYFDLRINNRKIKSHEFEYESIAGILNDPQFIARFNGNLLKASGQISLSLSKGSIQRQKDSFIFADTKIISDIVADFTDQGNGVSSKLSLTGNNIRIKSDLMESTFPGASLSGSFHLDKANTPLVNMLLKASKGKISAPEFKTYASGLNLEIPFHYPNTQKNVTGNYSISKLSYDNQYKFSTSGKILQTGLKKFQISGGVNLLTISDLKVQFKSIVWFEKGLNASLDFNTNHVSLNFTDIENIIPQKLQTADLDMIVFAKGKARFLNHHLKTSMSLNINDGKIFMPDTNFTATGINAIIELNDLLALESFPGQTLTIDTIEVNKIKIKNAKIRFTIEDGKSLLIENIRFNWCNGLVSTESIRFPQKNNSYFLTFYCDRLEMTQLLKQMGAFNAQGSGTLNGRIPVIYSDGDIAFDNGFLFSTPGSGGKVVIENSDRIIAGIPLDNPQFVQLDLAQEALKDFDYHWAKLVFNSFEDTLDVKMELNGKPSKVLPFEYKKEFGGFVRVDASSPGSQFEGIKLDVNLKLPFNDVMKFGNKIKSILN